MTLADPMARCHATSKHSGEPCKWPPMHGQNVCRYHGGKSPQALKKAEQRMRDLVHPAISALERQINNDEFAATKYVLDWAGFRPATESDKPSDNSVTVTVVFDRNAENAPSFSLPDSDTD